VAGPARRQVAPDLAFREGLEVALAAEAGVGRDLARRAAERRRGGIEQRHQPGLVAAVGGQALGDDDLMGRVDRELACCSPGRSRPGS
jgi:hypothetical protein